MEGAAFMVLRNSLKLWHYSTPKIINLHETHAHACMHNPLVCVWIAGSVCFCVKQTANNYLVTTIALTISKISTVMRCMYVCKYGCVYRVVCWQLSCLRCCVDAKLLILQLSLWLVFPSLGICTQSTLSSSPSLQIFWSLLLVLHEHFSCNLVIYYRALCW